MLCPSRVWFGAALPPPSHLESPHSLHRDGRVVAAPWVTPASSSPLLGQEEALSVVGMRWALRFLPPPPILGSRTGHRRNRLLRPCGWAALTKPYTHLPHLFHLPPAPRGVTQPHQLPLSLPQHPSPAIPLLGMLLSQGTAPLAQNDQCDTRS